MSITITGETLTFGVKAEWAVERITNLPEGAKVVRRCFRPRQAGVAFVKVGNELRKHYLRIGINGGLELSALVGLNKKEVA